MADEKKRLERAVTQQIRATEAEVKSFILSLDGFLKESLGEILGKVKGGTGLQAAAVLGSLYTELQKRGLADTLNPLKTTYANELRFIKEEFDAQGVSKALGGMDSATVSALIKADFAKVADKVRAYTSDVRQTMMKSIISGKKISFQELHQELGGRLAANLETEVNTMMIAFNRSVTFEKAKELGFEKFVYVGPIDKVTRKFCLTLLARQAGIYTRKEIEAMRNGQVDPVMIYGGGYNCRHHWRPVTDERAKEIQETAIPQSPDLVVGTPPPVDRKEPATAASAEIEKRNTALKSRMLAKSKDGTIEVGWGVTEAGKDWTRVGEKYSIRLTDSDIRTLRRAQVFNHLHPDDEPHPPSFADVTVMLAHGIREMRATVRTNEVFGAGEFRVVNERKAPMIDKIEERRQLAEASLAMKAFMETARRQLRQVAKSEKESQRLWTEYHMQMHEVFGKLLGYKVRFEADE